MDPALRDELPELEANQSQSKGPCWAMCLAMVLLICCVIAAACSAPEDREIRDGGEAKPEPVSESLPD